MNNFLLIKPINTLTILDISKIGNLDDMNLSKDLENLSGLILDLTNVEEIDSFGVNLIVKLMSIAKSKSKKFSVITKNNKILYMIKIDKLDKLFPVFSSIDECIESIS